MASDLGQKAKKTLEAFVPEIDKRIAEYFDEEIKKDFGFNEKQKKLDREILEHAKEYILRPTKRIRSSFVRYGARLGGEECDWGAAVGVELVHAGLLMHDDFMDNDSFRRGGLTTHEHFKKVMNDSHLGDAMAVTVGDAMLFMGLELISNSDNRPAMKQMLRGLANTGYGQAYDVGLEALKEWTEDDVIVLHKAKTAIYTYENPLFIGAHLAGLSKEVFEILHEYSMDGGVAFQLQDDILGVYGSPEKTGKSADSDLKQGKCTLMVLKAWDCPEVHKVWGDQNATREDLDAAKKAILDCGAYEYNKKLAREYAAKAARTAEKLRKFELNSEAIDFIQGIAEYMVEREV